MAIDLGLDTALEVLKRELLLHRGAGVGGISDECDFAQGASVLTDGLEVENHVARLVTELSVKFVHCGLTGASLDKGHCRRSIVRDASNSPAQLLLRHTAESLLDFSFDISLRHHSCFSFLELLFIITEKAEGFV